MNPGNGIETSKIQGFFVSEKGFLFMNPGNGIETLRYCSNGGNIFPSFLFMNPGNGIETLSFWIHNGVSCVSYL